VVDERIIDYVLNTQGGIIDHEDEVGGYPNLAVNTISHVLPANMLDTIGNSGYTNLEMWLDSIKAEVEGDSGDPRANAGPDQTVSDGDGNGVEIVTLDGSASYDRNGTIVSYEWKEAQLSLEQLQ